MRDAVRAVGRRRPSSAAFGDAPLRENRDDCASGHPARRAERHVGDDVVAVRTQHRLVGVDLVVRFVQQREVQTDSQQQKCHRSHREMDDQLQALWNPGDVDEPQCGVDGQHRHGEARQRGADVTRVLVNLARRAGEPQRRTDEAADRRGGQRDRHPADACLDDERADGRARATIPVANCGASRVRVAAAVKASAPSAPIMKPSNDSRVGGRSRRTTTAGTSIRIMLADRDAEPFPSYSVPPRSPAPSGTPYERATIAPVSSTHPTPSPIPNAAVRSSVRAG